MKLKDIIKYSIILIAITLIGLLFNKGGSEIQAFNDFIKKYNEGQQVPAIIEDGGDVNYYNISFSEFSLLRDFFTVVEAKNAKEAKTKAKSICASKYIGNNKKTITELDEFEEEYNVTYYFLSDEDSITKEQFALEFEKKSKSYKFKEGEIVEDGLISRKDWEEKINKEQKNTIAYMFLAKEKKSEDKEESEEPAFELLEEKDKAKKIKSFLKNLESSLGAEKKLVMPYILIGGLLSVSGLLLALVFSGIKLFSNRKNAIKMLSIIGAMILIFFISYI